MSTDECGTYRGLVSGNKRPKTATKPSVATQGGKGSVKLPNHFDVVLAAGGLQRAVWVLISIVIGVLCISKLGIVAQWVGVALVLWGAYGGVQCLNALRNKPSRFVLSGDTVRLPTGIANGATVELSMESVNHVYLRRRSTPPFTSSPLLVVETENKAFTYPRDWFANEADQMLVGSVLRKRIRDR